MCGVSSDFVTLGGGGREKTRATNIFVLEKKSSSTAPAEDAVEILERVELLVAAVLDDGLPKQKHTTRHVTVGVNGGSKGTDAVALPNKSSYLRRVARVVR